MRQIAKFQGILLNTRIIYVKSKLCKTEYVYILLYNYIDFFFTHITHVTLLPISILWEYPRIPANK